MLSKVLNRLIIYLFSVFWILFAAEMFLRIFEPQTMMPRYVEAGDFGIRVNMPNQTYTHKTPDYTVKIHTNSQGMRANQDFSYDKPKGKIRIVVLSDSFGMGYGVNLKDSFTEQMRRNLELELGKKVEVINLSVSGFGTAEELLMLQNEGVRYHPDLVLLAWHTTDPDDDIRSGLFEVKDGTLVRKNKTYLPGVKIRELLFSYKAYRWLAGNSHFYNWIRRRVSTTLKRWMVDLDKIKPMKNKEIGLLTKNIKADDSLSLALLKRIKIEANKVGANLLILEIPTRKSRTKFEKSLPDNIKKRFDVVSPIQEFELYSNELLYWEHSQGHFTPLGCKIIGKMLAKEIIKKNYGFL